MYGFDIIANGKKAEGDITYKEYCFCNRMIDKFSEDKIFYSSDKLVIVLDGVILNKRQLLKEYGDTSWPEVIEKMYLQNGEVFFFELRGSFSGAILDKSKGEKLIVFCDQLGSRFTYYSQIGEFLCVTEEMGHIYQLLEDNDIKPALSTEGSYMLLSYGFMLNDTTLCKQVNKINPGCYIVYENKSVVEKQYYQLDNTQNNLIKEDEAIEIVDNLFREAITQEFEKDKEYGYKHLVALSGGLDSRMTSLVAHACGYEQQLNFSFSQTNYWDEIIPKAIAEDYKHEWLFKSLDNGLWLFDVEEVTKKTGGNVLYYGTAHGDSMYRYINFSSLGLIHSGQLGDVVIGSHVSESDISELYQLGEGAYSNKLLSLLNSPKILGLNKELGLYYYRYLNGTNNGLQNVYNYTESLSPFMNLAFIEATLKIPVRLRYNHHLYKKWILSKYPGAGKYVWESIGTKITEKNVRWGKQEIPITRIPTKLYRSIRYKMGIPVNDKSNMNPIAYYYSHNNNLREYINSFKKYIDYVDDSELRNSLMQLMDKGTSTEQIQAVSLLCAIKNFFI